ncbi:unnamed protein product [Urochloa humidicola]
MHGTRAYGDRQRGGTAALDSLASIWDWRSEHSKATTLRSLRSNEAQACEDKSRLYHGTRRCNLVVYKTYDII